MQAKSARSAALVTAGAKRVGRELALRLASLGYDIALHFCNSADDASATKGEVEDLGRECHLFKADFENNADVAKLLPQVIERLPHLSVLINNASIWQSGKFIDATQNELVRYLRIHVEAPFLLSRDFSRLAKTGNIINILDCNIVKNKSENFAYLLSKKALFDFTLMAAAELAPEIRVNAVAPGAVLPPDDERNAKYTEKFGKNPLERPGSPSDVADAMQFLLQSDHISGQVIFVSGGKHLS
jgi:NAD(P)-dependent dehydrogenase (short-subunit alcohol dehydrogenase family)